MLNIQVLATTDPTTLRAGDRIQAIGEILTALRVESVRPEYGAAAHIIMTGGNIITLTAGTRVTYAREAESTSGYSSDDECLTCGAHISDPHAVDCERAA